MAAGNKLYHQLLLLSRFSHVRLSLIFHLCSVRTGISALSNIRTLLTLSQEKAMAPHSSTLAWQIPWTEEPGGLQSMGVAKSRT